MSISFGKRHSRWFNSKSDNMWFQDRAANGLCKLYDQGLAQHSLRRPTLSFKGLCITKNIEIKALLMKASAGALYLRPL